MARLNLYTWVLVAILCAPMANPAGAKNLLQPTQSGQTWLSLTQADIADDRAVNLGAKGKRPNPGKKAKLVKKTAPGKKAKPVKKTAPRKKTKKPEKKKKSKKNLKKPKDIPKNWLKKASKDGDGFVYMNPKKKKHDTVRVMNAKPNSPWKSQRRDYVVRQKDGKFFDRHGNEVQRKSDASHIPLAKFKFIP